MRLLALAFLVVAITGCNKVTESKTSNYDLPAELSDCKVYRMTGDGVSNTLHVVRCPNSETSTTWTGRNGKSNVDYSVTVIDN